VAVSLGAGLYLVGRGIVTLSDDGTKIALLEIQRLGKIVEEKLSQL
jgi:hypothetical protein